LGKKHLSEKLFFYSRTVSSYRRDIENHTLKNFIDFLILDLHTLIFHI